MAILYGSQQRSVQNIFHLQMNNEENIQIEYCFSFLFCFFKRKSVLDRALSASVALQSSPRTVLALKTTLLFCVSVQTHTTLLI